MTQYYVMFFFFKNIISLVNIKTNVNVIREKRLGGYFSYYNNAMKKQN